MLSKNFARIGQESKPLLTYAMCLADIGLMLSLKQISSETLIMSHSDTAFWVFGRNVRVVGVAVFTILINADRMDFARLLDRELER